MKNLDLKLMGVQEMDTLEMKETDGGFIWFLVAAAVVLLTANSCSNNNIIVQIGGSNNDPSQNGGGPISADSSTLEIPINVPIGY